MGDIARGEDLPHRFRRANALHAANRLPEAEAQWRAILQCEPGLMEARANLGNVLYEQGRVEEAIRCYREALAIAPRQATVMTNLAMVLDARGDGDEAAAWLARALALRPGHAPSECNLAYAQLRAGDYVQGWRTYEARLRIPQMAALLPRGVAQWRGEALHGRSILLIAEQGLGDTLQFARYAPWVAQRGARVVLEVQPELARLLGALPGVGRVIARGEPRPRTDFHCPLMSLPLAFGTTLQTIPAPSACLPDDRALVERWRDRLDELCAPGMRRIGLAWAGASRPEVPAAHAIDRRRSIAASQLAPLCGLPGVQFVSLQKGRGADALPAGLRLADPMAGVQDFADTAAIVKALDGVVSVDTSVAHVAATMGCPVWLLSRHDACWRWLHGRPDSPWYPGMRIVGQQRPGDWAGVLRRVAGALGAARDIEVRS